MAQPTLGTLQPLSIGRALAILTSLLLFATSCTSLEHSTQDTLPPNSLTRVEWLDTFDATLLVPLLAFIADYSEDVKAGLTQQECEERDDAFLAAFGPDGQVDGGSAFRAGPDDIADAGNELMGAAFWMVIGCTSDDSAATERGLEWARRAPIAFSHIYRVAEAERSE